MGEEKDDGELGQLARLEEPEPAPSAVATGPGEQHCHQHRAGQREHGSGTPIQDLAVVN